jgi:hypothetical protein
VVSVDVVLVAAVLVAAVLVAAVLVEMVLFELPGPKSPAWFEISRILLRLSFVRKVSPFHTFGPITPG